VTIDQMSIDYPLPLAREIRVLIADDHELIRSAVKQALRTADDIRVVGEAADGEGVLKALEDRQVDVVLLDVRMPRMDGFTCLDQLHAQSPDLSVLMLSVDDNRETAIEALRRGACGYVLKSIRPADLASAIRQAANGTVFMGGSGLSDAFAPKPEDDLDVTPRELEILRLVADGKCNQDIACELHVTVKTVKYHLTNIFAKLGVSNRTEAASFALKRGL